jgi:hypothetical protein
VAPDCAFGRNPWRLRDRAVAAAVGLAPSDTAQAACLGDAGAPAFGDCRRQAPQATSDFNRSGVSTGTINRRAQSMITVDEVHDFADRWSHAIAKGASAADQAAFFPILTRGSMWSERHDVQLEEHHRLHTQWINEATNSATST